MHAPNTLKASHVANTSSRTFPLMYMPGCKPRACSAVGAMSRSLEASESCQPFLTPGPLNKAGMYISLWLNIPCVSRQPPWSAVTIVSVLLKMPAVFNAPSSCPINLSMLWKKKQMEKKQEIALPQKSMERAYFLFHFVSQYVF